MSYNFRKRKYNEMKGTTEVKEKKKIPKILSFKPDLNYQIDSSWMAISKSRNASLKDYCLDYFEMYNIKHIDDKPRKSTFHRRNKNEEDNFKNFLFSSGNKFEQDIIQKIEERLEDEHRTVNRENFIKITDPWNAKSKSEYIKTLKAMEDQIPVIYQGILHNPKNKTYGAVDLLIREDYVDKLLNGGEEPSDTDELKRFIPTVF